MSRGLTLTMRLALSATAGIAHLGLCYWMDWSLRNATGETWGWFPMFVIDFPASLFFLVFMQELPPFLVYGVVGSLWWFAIMFLFLRNWRATQTSASDRLR
jgi:hypothetical protein